MNYQEYKPIESLSKYIDSYWIIQNSNDSFSQRIIPDCCNDIIINIGSEVIVNGVELLLNEKCYLVGNMTNYKDTLLQSNAFLIGIRFKPFGANHLLGFELDGTANTINELSLPEFNLKNFVTSETDIKCLFDAFFAKKNIDIRLPLPEIFDFIIAEKGNVRVSDLANKYYLSERQMQRIFKAKAGITVQELCKQVRLQNTITLLKKNLNRNSILDIAFEAGYYDHSHLTHDLIKYTGYSPSHYVPSIASEEIDN